MRQRLFFRHALLYGLSTALVQAGGVVLVPLYTRCLTKSDFGTLEVLSRCADFTVTLLLLNGLRQGLLALYQQSDGDRERAHVFRATLALGGCISLLVGSAIMLLAGSLCGLLQPESGQATSAGLLRLAVLAVLLEPFVTMPLALLQARAESATFLAVTASQFLVRVLACVALAVWMGWGVTGVLIASALTAGGYGVCLSVRELRRGGLAWPDRKHFGELLRFALPFLPGGVAGFLLQNGDRFFLLHGHGEEAVAVYGLGYKVALAVSMFSLSPLHMVWSARMFQAAKEADAPQLFGKVFTRILGAYVLVGLAVCLFRDEAMLLLGGRAYAGAAPVVPPVVLAGLFLAAAVLMDAGLYVRRRTGLKLGITLSSAVVGMALSAALIPPFGAMGAALATLGGYAFMAAATWRTAQPVFPVEYEWGRVFGLVSLAAGLWLASLLVPLGGWSIPMKAGLWLLWPLLAWVFRLVSPDEKAYVRSSVSQVLSWLRPRLRQAESSSSGTGALVPEVGS